MKDFHRVLLLPPIFFISGKKRQISEKGPCQTDVVDLVVLSCAVPTNLCDTAVP